MMVAATGEPHQLMSAELLESACARPKNRWAYEGEQDVVRLACTLCFAIAANHPFTQGNKRTAFVAMIGFLGANGYRVSFPDRRKTSQFIIDVIEGRDTQERFEEALRPHVHAI